MRNPLQGVNVLALVVVVTAAILTGMGKVDPESFLLLVTGLAIPARTDGYQAVGTAPRQVEVVNEPDNPVPTEDLGAGEVRTVVLITLGTLLAFVLFYFVVLPLTR